MKKLFFSAALLGLLSTPVFAQSLTTIEDLFPNGYMAASEVAKYDVERVDHLSKPYDVSILYYIKNDDKNAPKRLAYSIYMPPSKDAPVIIQYGQNGQARHKITFTRKVGVKSDVAVYTPRLAIEYREDGTVRSYRTFFLHEAPQYNDATYTIYKGKKVVQKDDKDVEVPVYESYTIANRDEQVADYKAYCENVLYYNKYMQLLDRAKTGDVSTDDLKPLLEQGGVIEHMVSEALDPYNHEAKNIILQRANYILEKAYTNRGTVELNDDLSREIKVATQLIFDNMAEVGANVDVQNRIARYAFTSAELAARSNKTATSTQAFNKIMEEINLTGKFSDQTISMLVQDGSLDFLANNSLDQYKEFINVFKDALKIEPGKGLYNLDYYKDTKFEEVVKSIKEIKAVIKK